jgi:hypothetical protein
MLKKKEKITYSGIITLPTMKTKQGISNLGKKKEINSLPLPISSFSFLIKVV